MYETVTDPTTRPPHLALRRALPKPLQESGPFKARRGPPVSLCGPAVNLSRSKAPLCLFAAPTVHRECAFVLTDKSSILFEAPSSCPIFHSGCGPPICLLIQVRPRRGRRGPQPWIHTGFVGPPAPSTALPGFRRPPWRQTPLGLEGWMDGPGHQVKRSGAGAERS